MTAALIHRPQAQNTPTTKQAITNSPSPPSLCQQAATLHIRGGRQCRAGRLTLNLAACRRWGFEKGMSKRQESVMCKWDRPADITHRQTVDLGSRHYKRIVCHM
jgi:hypothetical protein